MRRSSAASSQQSFQSNDNPRYPSVEENPPTTQPETEKKIKSQFYPSSISSSKVIPGDAKISSNMQLVSLETGAGGSSMTDRKLIIRAKEGTTNTLQKTVSLCGTMLALLQSTLGAGVVTLHYAVWANGLLLGPLLMLGAAALSFYTGSKLAAVADKVGCYTFREITEAVYGRRMAKAVNLLVAIDLLGVVTAYLVLLKNLVPHALVGAFGDIPSLFQSQSFWITIVTFGIIFPLLLLKTVRSLQFCSYVGFSSVLYLVVLVVAQYWLHAEDKSEVVREVPLFKFEPQAILTSYPMLFFAYYYQTLVPAAQLELRSRSLPRMRIALGLFLVLATVIYIVFGIFGFLQFARTPQQILRRNMLMVEPYASRPECQVAFLFFGISIVSSAALNFKPAKDSIRELISRRPLPTRTNFLLTLMLATICYALALLVPVISDAIAIKCCTSSPMVFMVFPILFHFRVDKQRCCSLRRLLGYSVIVLVLLGAVLSFAAFLLEKTGQA